MRLLLSMGIVPDARPGGPLRPRLRWLDPDSGVVTDALEIAPDAHPAPGEHAECTGAHVDDDGLLVQATRTEVLRLRLPELAIVERFSHPLLHDVHDACPLPGGGLAVSATGHDSVLVFDGERRLVRHVPLDGGDWSERYGAVDDFRRIPFDRFKPHAVHPNRVFLLQGRLWVTCLTTREARCLDGDVAPIRFQAPPHDGRLLDGELWFTTVDGHVIAVDPIRRVPTRTIDLRALTSSRRMPGWCRAVEKVGDRLFVGMTTLRSTRARELLRAALRGERGRKRPTRVVEVDLAHPGGPRIAAEHDVGNAAGGTLYGITALARPERAQRGRLGAPRSATAR